MRKKITTIENLARLMQDEFLNVGNEFTAVHKRFDKLEVEIRELRADVDDKSFG
jgi:hypothetical protein